MANSIEPAPTAAGDFWASYEIRRQLAGDEMQARYLVTDQRDGKTYWIQQIRRDDLPLEALQAIDDAHFPHIERAVVAGGMTFLVEEALEGRSLAEAGDGLSEEALKQVWEDLCRAVSYLHNRQLIHRNITISTVLLTEGRGVRLIDWSCVKLLTEEARDARPMGNADFAAPEQFGAQASDERSDIYGMGVTMKVLLDKKYQRKYRGDLKYVLEKCLEFDPHYRFQNAQELLDELVHGAIQQKRGRSYSRASTIFYFPFLLLLTMGVVTGLVPMLLAALGVGDGWPMVWGMLSVFVAPYLAMKFLHRWFHFCKQHLRWAYAWNMLVWGGYLSVINVLFVTLCVQVAGVTEDATIGMLDAAAFVFAILLAGFFGIRMTRRQFY